MTKRYRFKVLQIGVAPPRDEPLVVVVGRSATLGGAYGARAWAIEQAVGHYVTHRNREGGYVGICPAPYGMAVQLHAPDGQIESWRLYRVVGTA